MILTTSFIGELLQGEGGKRREEGAGQLERRRETGTIFRVHQRVGGGGVSLLREEEVDGREQREA